VPRPHHPHRLCHGMDTACNDPRQPPQLGRLPFAAVCDMFESLHGQRTAVIRQRVRDFVRAAVPDGSEGAYQLIRFGCSTHICV
jgi:hypothetical protein